MVSFFLYVCVGRLPVAVGQPDVLAASPDRWGGGSQLSRNLLWVHEWRRLRSVTDEHRISCLRLMCYLTLSMFPGSHTQSRGKWVETAPCLVGRTSSLTTSTSACMKKRTATTRWVKRRRGASVHGFTACAAVCSPFILLVFPSSGQVLCVGEGSVHSGLQHLAGVAHHSHGHPVQVQVNVALVWASNRNENTEVTDVLSSLYWFLGEKYFPAGRGFEQMYWLQDTPHLSQQRLDRSSHFWA